LNKILLISLLIAFFVVGVAGAEPLRVDADKFELAQDSQQAEFIGHVIATRDDVKLTANRMTIWYEKDEKTQKNIFKRAKAIGNVEVLSADTKALAQEVSLSADSNIVVLKGEASISSPQGYLTGEHIEYDTQTKNTKVLPSESGGKAHFVFEEKKNP